MPSRSPSKQQGSSLPISLEEKNVEEEPYWVKMFDELNAFKEQNGHCNVSTNDERNKYLGQWVSNQRVSYKKNALRSNRKQQLNSIGFIWDQYDHLWKEKFNQLCSYKVQNGH
eukprot:10710205-Ditylum_brightwellii.AAC.1